MELGRPVFSGLNSCLATHTVPGFSHVNYSVLRTSLFMNLWDLNSALPSLFSTFYQIMNQICESRTAIQRICTSYSAFNLDVLAQLQNLRNPCCRIEISCIDKINYSLRSLLNKQHKYTKVSISIAMNVSLFQFYFKKLHRTLSYIW